MKGCLRTHADMDGARIITLSLGAGFALCWIMMGRDIRELTEALEKSNSAATPVQRETKEIQ